MNEEKKEQKEAEKDYVKIPRKHANLTCLLLTHVDETINETINELQNQGAEAIET